jgi:hypothetical protein
MTRFLLGLSFTLLVSGCASSNITPQQLAAADCGPYPDNYQQIISDFYQQRLKDPESARYRFSTPVKGATLKPLLQGGGVDTYGWAVDVWINAKNSYGGYTGEQHHRMLIRDGIARVMITDEEIDRLLAR